MLAWPGVAWIGLVRLGVVRCCVSCVVFGWWLVAGGVNHVQTHPHPKKTTVIPQKHCQTTKNTVTTVPSFSFACGGEVGWAVSLSTTRVGIFISIDICLRDHRPSVKTN